LPVRRGRLVWRRLLAIGALVAAALFCAWLLLGAANDPYTVRAVVDDAGQVVTGNEVQVGGVPVGTVESVELRDDRLAELVLEVDEEMAPLHEGTTATIRNPSLTSVAGRYVALFPGPNDREEIPDDGEIPTEDTQEIVDLDQLLNSLDPRTVEALSQFVRGSSDAARGRGDELAAAIESLNPALSRGAATLDEITRDQEALERLVVSTADVVSTLAARRDEISTGTSAAGEALDAIADEREALTGTLEKAPRTLGTAIPTLADVRSLLAEVRPALVEGRPAVGALARLMPELRPVSRGLRRELPRVRTLISKPAQNDDLTDLLGSLPSLGGQAKPLLEDLTALTSDSRPVLEEVRAYIPELTGGIVAGFGGSSGGYYDANGHYARIAFLGGPFSLTGLPTPPTSGALKTFATRRCPGGAIYKASDQSNPFVEPSLSCDPGLTAGGP
jgi:phospholipid/cholesterol/gamma-HCH transport system substrate-binding protein